MGFHGGLGGFEHGGSGPGAGGFGHGGFGSPVGFGGFESPVGFGGFGSPFGNPFFFRQPYQGTSYQLSPGQPTMPYVETPHHMYPVQQMAPQFYTSNRNDLVPD
jgi:hypothetical protein